MRIEASALNGHLTARVGVALAVVGLALGAASCESRAPERDLDLVAPNPAGDPEIERLQRMQWVSVTMETPVGDGGVIRTPLELPVSCLGWNVCADPNLDVSSAAWSLAAWVLVGCGQTTPCGTFASDASARDGSAGSCTEAHCDVRRSLCVANTMAQLAERRRGDATIPLLPQNGAQLVVPPQPPEVLARLHSQAAFWAEAAMDYANSAMFGGPPPAPNSAVAPLEPLAVLTGLRTDYPDPERCPIFAIGGGSLSHTLAAPDVDVTFAESFASSFLEGERVAREGFDGMVAEIAAFAEAQRGSSASVRDAVLKEVKTPLLSRTAAAAGLVGGAQLVLDMLTQPSAVPPSLTDTLCTAEELDEGARAALDVLRTVAPNPDAVVASDVELPLATLLDGESAAFSPQAWGPSVRTRLAHLLGVDEAEAPSSVAAQLKLRVEDFARAREYLRQEDRVFSRTRRTLPRRTLSGGRPELYDRYAGVASAPRPLPAAYRAALLRQSGTHSFPPPEGTSDIFSAFSAPSGVRSTPVWTQTTLAMLRDASRLRVAELFDHWTTTDMLGLSMMWWLRQGGASTGRMVDLLAGHMAQGAAARPGHLVISSTASGLQGFVTGYPAADDLRVVAGEDGLRCAVDGSVEGAGCTVDEYTAWKLSGQAIAPSGPSLSEFRSDGLAFRLQPFTPPAGSGQGLNAAPAGARIYLVRRSPGSPGAPGDYSALGGVVVPEPPYQTDPPGIFYSPLTPDLDERASALLEPSAEWCSRPRLSCAGEDIDERVPLEDELSQDGDGVESSWKHYLALARRAAEEADALGEQYLSANADIQRRNEELSMRAQLQRERAEDEIDRVQQICGTAMDPSLLLDLLSGAAVPVPVGTACQGTSTCGPGQTCVSGQCAGPVGQTCAQSTQCASDQRCDGGVCVGKSRNLSAVDATGCTINANCRAEQSCVAGVCVHDVAALVTRYASAYPDLSRLAECLDPGSVHDIVALGDRPICLWKSPTDENVLCEGATDQLPCPRVMRTDSTNPDLCPRPTGTVPVLVASSEKLLGYFHAYNVSTSPCEDLGRVRTSSNRAEQREALETVVASHALSGDQLARAAAALTLEMGLQTHGTLSVHGEARYSTGSAWTGALASGRPCGALPDNCVVGDPRFECIADDCATANGRARLVRRMHDAVASAAVISGKPVSLGLVRTQTMTTLGPSAIVPTQVVQRADSIRMWEGRAAQGGDLRWYQRAYEGNLAANATDEAFKAFLGGETYEMHPLGIVAGGSASDYTTFELVRQSPAYVGSESAKKFSGGLDPTEAKNGYFWGAIDSRVLANYAPRGPETPTVTGSVSGAYAGASVVSSQSLWDGLELLCDAAEWRGADFGAPPDISSAADLPKAAAYLRRVAQRVETRGAAMLLGRVPTRAASVLKEAGALGSFPAVGGQYGVELSALRGALVRVSEFGPRLAAEVRELAKDVDRVELAIHSLGISEKMEDVKFRSQEFGAVAGCATGVVGGVTDFVTKGNPMQFAMSAVDCAVSMAQLDFANELRELAKEKLDVEKNITLSDFSSRFEQRVQNVRSIRADILAASQDLSASLAGMESLRLEAQRTIASALWAGSAQAQGEAGVNASLLSRYSTAGARYRNSHKSAVRLAFLAKRAVETRLGVRLSSLDSDLPLVDAPSRWESSVCTAKPIEAPAAPGQTGSADDTRRIDYSDAYLSDYVDKLEMTVESYRLVNNFRDATDTAVISLRDDVLASKAFCETTVNNLLLESGNLDALGGDPEAAPGWSPTGCALVAGSTTDHKDGCLYARVDTDPASALPPIGDDNWDTPRPYRLMAGTAAAGDGCDPDPTVPCGYQPGVSALAQGVRLRGGEYRLSWFESGEGSADVEAVSGCVLRPAPTDEPWDCSAGVAIPTSSDPGATGEVDIGGGWGREYFRFVVDQPEALVVVRLRYPGIGGRIAGLMLEDVSSSAGLASFDDEPTRYAGTRGTSTRLQRTCSDTEGVAFRSSWSRRCADVCTTGLGRCDTAALQTRCYWENSFGISQNAIEARRIFARSGFALGNYNYRVESLGLNFVGSNLRNCSESGAPATCYAAGYIPYSIHHGGPYHVRNHAGEDVRVALFPGRIEHARGLATERYLTNPLSTSDSSLIDQYMRQELQGRPLDGHFVVRVWDDEGVDFDAIEDVQVVLKYRYWTRNN